LIISFNSNYSSPCSWRAGRPLQGEGGALPDKLFHNSAPADGRVYQNLRAKEIHLAISGGSYPAHTNQQVVMGAGIFGMIIPFDSMMNSAPAVSKTSTDYQQMFETQLTAIFRMAPCVGEDGFMRGNGGASEFGDDAASQDGGAPDLISSDDESEELGAAGTSGG
jgi:hypothetical protein